MDEDRQEPREYDIDMFGAFACPDEVFESLEELQYKLEELQCTCDDYAKKNNQWQQIVIDKEKEHNDIVNQLKEEIDKLKKENLRISKERIFRDYLPSWFKKAKNIIDQENKLRDLDYKINDLTVMLMEKDKKISSLGWEVKDAKATITALTSDRNKLIMEMENMELRLEQLEEENSMQQNLSVMTHSESIENSSEEEQMSCSDKRSNQPDSCVSNEDDSEDGCGFGQLKRAANFSNINTLDESAEFRMDPDQMSIFSGDGADQSSHNGTDYYVDKNFCDDGEFESMASNTRQNQNISPLMEQKGMSIFNDKNVNESSRKVKDNQEENLDRSYLEDEVFETEPSQSKSEQKLFASKWQSFESNLVNNNNNNITIEKDGETKIHIKVINSPPDPWTSPTDSQQHTAHSNNSETDDINSLTCLDSAEESDISQHERIDSFKDSFIKDEKCFDKHFSDQVGSGKVVLHKMRKNDSWDFEPDSIIDVSTGKALSTSEAAERFSPKPDKHEDSDILTSISVNTSSSASSQRRNKPSDDDIVNSKESAQALRGVVTSKHQHASAPIKSQRNSHRNRSKEKGKSSPEKEALEAYTQWKSQGKRGTPPVNFKVSFPSRSNGSCEELTRNIKIQSCENEQTPSRKKRKSGKLTKIWMV